MPINQIHGSDSEDQAKKEIDYFFPMQQTVAVIKPDAYQTKGILNCIIVHIWFDFIATTVENLHKVSHIHANWININ